MNSNRLAPVIVGAGARAAEGARLPHGVMAPLITWKWKALSEPTGCRGAAVYAVRLLDRGAVVSIPRFLSIDAEGVLTIGMTTNLERRRRHFVRGYAKGRGHSAGNLLHFLSAIETFNLAFPERSYEISFRAVTDGGEARRLEAQVTKEYLARFGEGPPLTSVIPDRYSQLRGG